MVEDNPADVELTRLALKSNNLDYDLVHFPDGQSFLSWLEGQDTLLLKYCMVLLDLNMSGLPGLDVLKRLKKHPTWSKLPVVIFSSSARIEDVESCYEAGANAYVLKPLNFEEFEQKIGNIFTFWGKFNIRLTV